jgi:hypothetical protein
VDPNSFEYLEKEECSRVVHAHAPQYPKLPTCIYKGRHGFEEDQRAQAAEV